MRITLKDVAERAGVSRSAVSRAFTSGASVSTSKRRKIEQAAAELGYSPNALASSLTTGRTKLIGLVSNNFHNPFFLEVFDQFTRGLQRRGLRPLLVNLSGEMDAQSAIVMLRQYSVDGVIVASSTVSPDFAVALRAARMPVVHSFGRLAWSPRVSVVGINNVECGRMAAQALAARGYLRVGFLGGPARATSTIDRREGFLEAARTAGLDVSESYATDYSFDAGRAEMLDLLRSPPAEAYFCGDDVLSIGALSAISERGLKVPDDIGIIGLNDMEMSRWQNINLTTIRQPIESIIESSIELVVATLENPERAAESRVFACELVERATLRPPPR